MTWQALISEAATQTFLRTGKVGSFKLARRDLFALAAEVMKRPLESVVSEAGNGFLTLRVQTHCEPLNRAVQVDEWVSP